ncbi:MAG: hypothetical protein A2174_00075 [Candidatus Portnoybacteria bacterium RBG_13_41_18]|uniref:Sortase n=1 Tax=Candidatus Portnoybacteria bacterium RBG_13_41_18 TaxID=1801991 RepID=A0A1G2FBK2_9BACT|nr:MAG: hypothetical protein A2174_00075 [Candidatus Portnoybacteria bacterium RBG_13_41_18]
MNQKKALFGLFYFCSKPLTKQLISFIITYSMVNIKTDKKIPVLGCLAKAGFLSVFIWFLAIIINAILGSPKMGISAMSAFFIFLFLMSFFVWVIFWSILSLHLGKKQGKLSEFGAYQFIRHPMYSAIIFLFFPAIAILLRSWILIIACLPIYLIWRSAIADEDSQLKNTFGEVFANYKKNVRPFFPNFLKINKYIFFGVSTLAFFLIIFVGLNFSAFYLRAVSWQEEGEEITPIKIEKTENINVLPASENIPPRPKPIYNEPNSIIISKIGIRAPLVFASGVSQKELNAALNQGVLVYPGSKLPGEAGEVFLTGHSSTYIWNKTPFGQVFTLLDKLEIGDIVTVYYGQHKFDYQVTNKFVTTPDKVALKSASDTKTITLFTCWPIGTTWKRLVVEGAEIE